MLQFDSQQFLPWPADGTLTVTSVRPNSTNDAETVSLYATYPGAVREARPSNGVFTLQDCKVTFASDAISFDLKPRDTLAFGGNTWVVKQAQRFDWLKFWDVQCFRLVVQADLCSSVVVQRPTATQTDGGFRSVSLSTLDTINGRVQSEGMEAVREDDGQFATRERFKAYLAEPIPLYAGDVLTVGGDVYEVIGQGDIDQLETFSYATCVRVS